MNASINRIIKWCKEIESKTYKFLNSYPYKLMCENENTAIVLFLIQL